MEFDARYAMRPVLFAKIQSLTADEFQTFFQNLMCIVFPDFIDVRTHGNIGDRSSDGFTLHDGKLYASYAQEVFDEDKLIGKFKSDILGATSKRAGEFSTFVFVHNDLRGVHPNLSSELVAAQQQNPGIKFELMGFTRIRDLFGGITEQQAEDLLGTKIPLHSETSIGLHEMEDLLTHLASSRVAVGDGLELNEVSADKLEYSELSEGTQSELRDGMKSNSAIDDYYRQRTDILERDEVAARFNVEYQRIRQGMSDPEDILLQLQIFLGGTGVTPRVRYRAVTAVLAYFFQTCDIFENPPPGWRRFEEGGAG